MDKLTPLIPYFKPYRRQLLLGVSCILGTAVVGLLSPLVIGRAIDAMQFNVTSRTLFIYGISIILIALVQGLFRYGQRMILITMSRHVEFDLRNDFFAHLEKLHRGFYDRNYTGDLMARATNDLHAVRMLCGPAIMYGANTLFTGVGALVLMLNVHVKLTLVAIFTLPLVALLTKVFGQRIHALFQKVQEHFSALSTRVQENLSGARVVRAYAQESTEEETFNRLSVEYVDKNRQLIRWNAAFFPVLQGLVGLGFVAVLAFGGRLMIRGEITVGQFVTFHLFFGELVWPMIAIGWVINIFQRGTASLERIQDILKIEPKIRDEEPLEQVAEVTGAIRFEELNFTYEEDVVVLENIDFEVSAGETLAIVGRTGSGKSTLLSLIPRLYDPPQERLQLDGIDVRRLPLDTLRQSIAMVPQESFLFSATIRENIAFGTLQASDEDVRRAAKLADLGSDLAGFPKGLDTMVGERGITLSGGQKQRVSLARALVRRPRILLLDDCLSAVDAQTEERIMKNLRKVFPGRTVFFVSHRVSAAQTADQILVLEHGKIAERGDHRDLLQQQGLYADLYRRQRLEEELAAV